MRWFWTSPPTLAPLRLGIGPAGAGKTTAMRALGAVLASQGRTLVPLAASAKAAEVLGSELGVRAENLHKFLHELDRLATGQPASAGADGDFFRLGPATVVLLDEAAMAATLLTDRLQTHARAAGAVVRAVGDPAQLGSVEGAGWVRLLRDEVGAVELSTVHRFTDPVLARATLQLREGNPAGLDYFAHNGLVHDGAGTEMAQAALDGWLQDTAAGLTSIMIGARAEDVGELAARARLDLVSTGHVEADGVELYDGNLAGVGDLVVTRRNQDLAGSATRPVRVRNGGIWSVTARHPDGSLSVRRQHNHVSGLRLARVRLPAGYVTEHVDLAYAATIHRAQGATVDTTHAVLGAGLTREQFYVAASRARDRTTLYVATDAGSDTDGLRPPTSPRTGWQILLGALAAETNEASAHETVRHASEQATSLPTLAGQNRRARDVAVEDSCARLLRRVLGAETVAALRRDADWPRLVSVLPAAVASDANVADLLLAALAASEGRPAARTLVAHLKADGQGARRAGADRTWTDYLKGRQALVESAATSHRWSRSLSTSAEPTPIPHRRPTRQAR